MAIDQAIHSAYIDILNRELMLAEGCTEPVAIAYAAALARQTLGYEPVALEVHCSRSFIKNAKSAVVPNLDGQKGIPAAAIAGALGGDPSKRLDMMAHFDTSLSERVDQLARSGYCKVMLLPSDENLHIMVTALGRDGDRANVTIKYRHDNVVCVEKNGEILLRKNSKEAAVEESLYVLLSLSRIYDFASEVELDRVSGLLNNQLEHNIAICREGLENRYGAGIGRILLEQSGEDVERLACAYAAAGSDARMSGCPMAVVINSGSGNQGITVTAPVWVFARHLGAGEPLLLRALCISNLVAIYLKSKVGRLSAYCGAVCAACGSGAGITYLHGGTFEQVANTVSNAVVNVSGIVCDGAKPSCAAKIASSLQAAILGHKMAMQGQNFNPGDGIIGANPEKTLHNVGCLASEGLVKMDEVLLNIMLEHPS